MCILKRHGLEGLPHGFVTLLNKFSCKFCQLTLGARQYLKSQCMKQQRATKQASTSKSKKAKADVADADSDPTVEQESVLPQNPVEITDL
eukprot:3386852-Rhodomonas_salina.1